MCHVWYWTCGGMWTRNYDYYYCKFKTPWQAQHVERPAEGPQPPKQPQSPPRTDPVQKVGDIVGALAFKQFNPGGYQDER